MKTRLILYLFAGGCLTCAAADSVRPDDATATWVDSADPSVSAIRQSGEKVIDQIGRRLISEVNHLVAEQGLAKAVAAVHLKDFALPKSEPGQPQVTAIKRTSLSLRNPANQPDIADQLALDLIKTALADGDPVPSLLVQRLERPAGPVEWRVYRPLTTMPICLNCHGPIETLKPEVSSYLAEHFPSDQAIGYSARQWRGLIRVSLADPGAGPVKAK